MIALLPERIREKLEIAAGSGCWLWLASANKDGYGHVRWEGAIQSAHRVVYKLLVGPIPGGHELHHRETCPRRCCNPWHLTPIEPKPHRQLHRPTHCQRGHELSDENSYVPKDGNRRCRTCIRERKKAQRDG